MEIRRADLASAVSPYAVSLPPTVPDISAEDLEAVLSASKSARKLDAHLRKCCDAGRCVSDHDFDTILKHAGQNERHAVVLAYWAQQHGDVFAPHCHKRLADFLGKQDWAEIRAEIDALLDKIQQQEIEAEKKRELEKERLEDEVIKPLERHRELIKENGTLAERAAERRKLAARKAEDKERIREASFAEIDDELTLKGRLNLSDVELTQLGLIKKGFANRE